MQEHQTDPEHQERENRRNHLCGQVPGQVQETRDVVPEKQTEQEKDDPGKHYNLLLTTEWDTIARHGTPAEIGVEHTNDDTDHNGRAVAVQVNSQDFHRYPFRPW
jgi:hypothetical protein